MMYTKYIFIVLYRLTTCMRSMTLLTTNILKTNRRHVGDKLISDTTMASNTNVLSNSVEVQGNYNCFVRFHRTYIVSK